MCGGEDVGEDDGGGSEEDLIYRIKHGWMKWRETSDFCSIKRLTDQFEM